MINITKRHPTAILHDKYISAIPTVPMLIAKILNPKKCSEILKELKAKLPLDQDLKHLKRIRSIVNENGKKELEVLLMQGCNVEECTRSLDSFGLCLHLSDVKTKQVPALEPLTRDQYKHCAAQWPTSFFEDKRVTRMQNKTYFSLEELEYIHDMFLHVSRCAFDAEKRGKNGVVSSVVDPSTNQILAIAEDCTALGQPLFHSCYVAIDMVARRQGGGALRISYHKNDKTGTVTLCKCVDIPGTVDDRDTVVLQRGTFCSHGNDLRCQESYSCRTGENDPRSSAQAESNHHLKRSKKCSEILQRQPTEYLCTGYDVFTTHEPCVFCSMALLHSRIKRVFYIEPDEKHGGLGGKHKIHVQEGLNHCFEVFKW